MKIIAQRNIMVQSIPSTILESIIADMVIIFD